MISSKLKKLREACGFTQQQVADILQIDRSTYSYYETGKTTPDLKTIKKLIKIFNISYMDILENDEPFINTKVNDISNSSYYNYNCNYHSNSKINNSDYIPKLTKDEKNLIMAYRLLSNEEKENILKLVKAKVKPK